MSNRMVKSIVVVSALYVAAQIFADITSLRILLVFGLSIDAGTLVYPFTFTLRDMVHKTAGREVARILIVLAAVINLFMAGLFWLASALPPDMAVGSQEAFGQVLSPVVRIVLASIVAEVIAELIDTEVYHFWVMRFNGKRQWMRVVSSNAVSVPVDSALFCSLAFVGVLPGVVVWSIFISNILVKGLVTVISIPGIYMVKESHPETQP